MGNDWRPDNWAEAADAMVKQCAKDVKFINAEFPNVLRGMFEAGASVMLKALKKEGNYCKADEWTDNVGAFVPETNGYLVWIPEEELKGGE
jgi:hypothetical protein